MCGIVGAVTDKAIDDFDRAVESLRHRGPDACGSIEMPLQGAGGQKVFLGHQRLSIIDLSPAGKQPMSNEDGSVWITYNGEIYNFEELRQGLGHQHVFRSKTDTEVLLHLYEEKDIRCLDELNGMFAFAVYDSKKRRVILARDRLGIKPLYYAHHKGTLVFGSEIKAILALGIIPQETNWQAIYDYFSYLYVPCPKTAFKGIYQLPPAHYLMYDIERRSISIQRYWDPMEFGASLGVYQYEDLKERLHSLLSDSVRKRLISDVPLGLFLSGGIDSTILAGLMAQSSQEQLKTFTVRFQGAGIAPYDETQYARTVSRRFGTQHHEITVDISDVSGLFDLIQYFDQPFANPTFYLSYLISQKTREHVTVAISGAGGDELFGGYPRYKVIPYARTLGRMPRMFGTLSGGMLSCLREDFDSLKLRRMKLLTRGIGLDFPEQYLRWTYYFSDQEKQGLFTPDFLRSCDPIEPSVNVIRHLLDRAAHLDSLDKQVMCLDLNTFLADNILEYTDKMSMAVGLETRVPLLDHRIVELAFGLQRDHKIHKGVTKHILKDTFSDIIPRDNLHAPKRGFCPPLATWVENHLDGYFDRVMNRKYVNRQGIFNWDYMQKLRVAHKERRRDNSMELFGIIMFDAWYRSDVRSWQLV